MQPISLSKTQDVISHLMAGDSYRKIEMETGVSKSNIALIKQKLCLDKENLMGGRPTSGNTDTTTLVNVVPVVVIFLLQSPYKLRLYCCH